MRTFELILHMWIIFPIVLIALSVGTISILIVMTGHIQHNIQDFSELVTTVPFPFEAICHLFQTMKIVISFILCIMILAIVFGSYVILQVFRRSKEQEAVLQANIIRLKDAVLQAERKSMNKSLAFASASHDVRTSLAGISGLIELCRGDIPPQSELDANLVQMNTCASKLLGILNSVLDMSKVEAGKMQLEDVKFDISQVLEESVDIFYVVALKKGLEVIWDPCDFSVLKSPYVKGDCRRLKQILDNLLGNAVKFTSSGNVILRAWAKKPSLQNSKPFSKHNYRFPKSFPSLSRWIYKDDNDDGYCDVKNLTSTLHDSNSVEFVFEVDDTGMGIPKEKRASIFENYVQVKELSSGVHEGTGLGLGIVQSFVRLMGGEINIQDKEHGARGTCFRFNIFLKSCETTFSSFEGEDKSPYNRETSSQSFSIQSNLRAQTFRGPLKVDGIQSLILIEGDETRKILQRWMENIGIKVWLVHHWELLYSMLEKSKYIDNGSGKFDATLHEPSLNRIKSFDSHGEKDLSHSSNDEIDQILPLSTREAYKKRSKDSSTCILIVIDITSGDFSNICSILDNFSKANQKITFKVVWFVNPNTQSSELRRLKQRFCDLVLKKPIHGSRLYEILRLLQDLTGRNEARLTIRRSQDTLCDIQQPNKQNLLKENNQTQQVSQSIQHKFDTKNPLNGMKILLVEDTLLMRRIAYGILSSLGATVKSAENGLEALKLIKEALQGENHDYDENGKAQGVSRYLPYEVVLMDCEMPIMDGYEATKKIREEEKFYDIHIPIIALSAHATIEEEKKAILSGMDLYLMKPINRERIVEAIRRFYQNQKTM